MFFSDSVVSVEAERRPRALSLRFVLRVVLPTVLIAVFQKPRYLKHLPELMSSLSTSATEIPTQPVISSVSLCNKSIRRLQCRRLPSSTTCRYAVSPSTLSGFTDCRQRPLTHDTETLPNDSPESFVFVFVASYPSHYVTNPYPPIVPQDLSHV